MKVLTVFYTLILLFLVPLTVFGDLESEGPPSCESSFNGNLLERSKPNIIEKYKWVDLDSMYPKFKKTEVKPAKIFGKVTVEQATTGTGVVGVKAEGDVTGPNFEMKIGPEFKTNSITLLDYLVPFTDDPGGAVTKKSAKSKKNTEEEGTYTLNGYGEVIAVSGGGGLSYKGTGFRISGSVTFSSSPTAEAQTLDVTVKQDYPKAYTCEHRNCDVKLPSPDHHLVTCGIKFPNHHGGVGICRAKYYVCQGNCLLASSGSGSGVLLANGGCTPASNGGNPPVWWQSACLKWWLYTDINACRLFTT